MLSHFRCPACNADAWKTITTNTYDRNEIPNSNYTKLRMRVLFELWCPQQETVKLTTVLCRCCGFMTYSPRPDAADISSKYRFLQQLEENLGGLSNSKKASSIAALRSRAIYQSVVEARPNRSLDVLDYGGGDGKLLSAFIAAGHNCFLVDYNIRPREGIVKLGDTLEDVPTDALFDVIICSHVLEHLADPARHLQWMKQHLSKDGIIYAEVPLDTWKGIRIDRDPVTHINYFTRYAFGQLLIHQGLNLEAIERRVGWYSRRIDVIIALASTEQSATIRLDGGAEEALQLLRPSLTDSIRRYFRLRRLPSFRRMLKLAFKPHR